MTDAERDDFNAMQAALLSQARGLKAAWAQIHAHQALFQALIVTHPDRPALLGAFLEAAEQQQGEAGFRPVTEKDLQLFADAHAHVQRMIENAP